VAFKEFKWQEFQNPLTPPSAINRFKAIDQYLNNLRAELVGVPTRIAPIEWEEWSNKIQDQDAVKSIQEQYEKLSFDQGDEGKSKSSSLAAKFDKLIARLNQNADLSREELVSLKEELSDAEKEKREIHDWSLNDWMINNPGLADQLRTEYMEGYQLPTDAQDRVAESDINEIRRLLRAGGKLAVDAELPTKIGNYDALEDEKHTIELAKKMFGDSPHWKEVERIIEENRIKKVEDEHH